MERNILHCVRGTLTHTDTHTHLHTCTSFSEEFGTLLPIMHLVFLPLLMSGFICLGWRKRTKNFFSQFHSFELVGWTEALPLLAPQSVYSAKMAPLSSCSSESLGMVFKVWTCRFKTVYELTKRNVLEIVTKPCPPEGVTDFILFLALLFFCFVFFLLLFVFSCIFIYKYTSSFLWFLVNEAVAMETRRRSITSHLLWPKTSDCDIKDEY